MAQCLKAVKDSIILKYIPVKLVTLSGCYLVYLYTNFTCMNWTIIIIVAILLIALVVFLVRRNFKDEKEFENQQNNDYHKSKEEEGDIDSETSTK
jgi:uncharacterized membrane protein